MKRQWHI